LMNQFATVVARRHCDVQSSFVTALGGLGNLEYRVSFGMQNIPFGYSGIIFTAIFKTGGCTVVSVRDNHPVFYYNRSDFFSLAIRQFPPFLSNSKVGSIVSFGLIC